MKQQRQREDFVISLRCSAVDMRLVQEMAESMSVSNSDIIKLGLWDFAASPKNKLLRDSLKELAFQRKKSFEINVLKELEFINNQQAFFIDGFKTSLNNYKNKHVPMTFVRRFVIIKLIGLYGSFRESSTRKEYLKYIRQNFNYIYPKEKAWLQKQVSLIRNMKKDEKDKLLLQIRTNSLNDDYPDFLENLNQDGDVDVNIMKILPKSKQKAIKGYLAREKIKTEARLQFYQNKDKYYKGKKEDDA